MRRKEFEAFGVLKGVVKAARAGDQPDKMIIFRNAFAAGYTTAANAAEVRPSPELAVFRTAIRPGHAKHVSNLMHGFAGRGCWFGAREWRAEEPGCCRAASGTIAACSRHVARSRRVRRPRRCDRQVGELACQAQRQHEVRRRQGRVHSTGALPYLLTVLYLPSARSLMCVECSHPSSVNIVQLAEQFTQNSRS